MRLTANPVLGDICQAECAVAPIKELTYVWSISQTVNATTTITPYVTDLGDGTDRTTYSLKSGHVTVGNDGSIASVPTTIVDGVTLYVNYDQYEFQNTSIG